MMTLNEICVDSIEQYQEICKSKTYNFEFYPGYPLPIHFSKKPKINRVEGNKIYIGIENSDFDGEGSYLMQQREQLLIDEYQVKQHIKKRLEEIVPSKSCAGMKAWIIEHNLEDELSDCTDILDQLSVHVQQVYDAIKIYSQKVSKD